MLWAGYFSLIIKIYTELSFLFLKYPYKNRNGAPLKNLRVGIIEVTQVTEPDWKSLLLEVAERSRINRPRKMID